MKMSTGFVALASMSFINLLQPLASFADCLDDPLELVCNGSFEYPFSAQGGPQINCPGATSSQFFFPNSSCYVPNINSVTRDSSLLGVADVYSKWFDGFSTFKKDDVRKLPQTNSKWPILEPAYGLGFSMAHLSKLPNVQMDGPDNLSSLVIALKETIQPGTPIQFSFDTLPFSSFETTYDRAVIHLTFSDGGGYASYIKLVHPETQANMPYNGWQHTCWNIVWNGTSNYITLRALFWAATGNGRSGSADAFIDNISVRTTDELCPDVYVPPSPTPQAPTPTPYPTPVIPVDGGGNGGTNLEPCQNPQGSITAYPNPVIRGNEIKLALTSGAAQSSIEMFAINGAQVGRWNTRVGSGSAAGSIRVPPSLSAGVYVIRTRFTGCANAKDQSVKILVQ